MIIRIPQRTEDDCATCAVAMVMGPPYSYERVLADSGKYSKTSGDGKFVCWWETYLGDEGFQTAWRPFSDLYSLPHFAGSVVGLLGMYLPDLGKGHIVAVDELGVVDPATTAPAHIALQDYVSARPDGAPIRNPDGAVFHGEFLQVTRSRSDARYGKRHLTQWQPALLFCRSMIELPDTIPPAHGTIR
jgi:hypothetical protein